MYFDQLSGSRTWAHAKTSHRDDHEIARRGHTQDTRRHRREITCRNDQKNARRNEDRRGECKQFKSQDQHQAGAKMGGPGPRPQAARTP